MRMRIMPYMNRFRKGLGSMNRTKFIPCFLHIVVVIFAMAAIAQCTKTDAGTHLGVEIPSDAEIVQLAAIVENPTDYNGKNVVMKGIISGQCPSLCEFFFKDGVHKATIFPHGYKFPRFTSGKPVTVYAQVTSTPERAVFSALGLHVQ